MKLAALVRLRPAAETVHRINRCRKAMAQRGAVLVEAAIVMPLVALLLFGILEYGLLFGDDMRLANSLRSGARTAAALTSLNASDDYAVLKAVQAGSGKVAPQIQLLVIYKSNGPSDVPTKACEEGLSQPGECNVYTQNDFNMTETQLEATGASNSWPPDERIPGTDYIGVWAKVDHKWITGFFGTDHEVTDSAVMRVQPSPTSAASSAPGYWPPPIQTTTTTQPPTTTTVKKSTTSTVKKKVTTTTAAQPTTTEKATTTTVGPPPPF